MITLIIGLASGIFIAILINNIISRYVRFSFDIKMALTRRSAAIFLGSILLIVTIILPFIYKTINNRKLNGPRLILGTTVLDVGDINLGDTYVSSIWIANNGINLLKIDDKKIKTSCSCFRYKISELELKQSDKSELKFKITPAKKLGPFQYSIYIPSNDPQGGKVLTVKGLVKGAGGVIYPPRLYFGRITNAKGKRKELFYILRRPDVEVLNVTSDLPFVTCTFSKRISGAHEIDVSLTKIPKPGPFEGSIKIVTNDPETEYAEISVPISGIVTPVSEDKLLSVK